MNPLYVPTAAGVFGRGDEEKLAAALADETAHTIAWEPTRWEDLMLAPDGTLPDGSRFTQRGLAAVCDELARGLFRTVFDLSEPGPDGRDGATSAKDAASVFNLAVRRRFASRIRDRRALVRDLKAGTIDGVTSPGAAVFTNNDLFEMVRVELGCSGRRVVMVEASLIGRRLTLRYADRKRLARAPDGVAWHGGFFVAGSESIGEVVMRWSPGVYAPATRAWATGPAKSSRGRPGSPAGARALAHGAANMAIAAAPDAAAFAAGLATLATKVAVPAGRGDGPRTAMIRAVDALTRRGMPKSAARDVVVAARYGGAADGAPLGPLDDGPAAITWLDVYGAALAAAARKHSDLRERMERTAYELVMRKRNDGRRR